MGKRERAEIAAERETLLSQRVYRYASSRAWDFDVIIMSEL